MQNHERTWGWSALWVLLFALAMATLIVVLGTIQNAAAETVWHTTNQATIEWDAVTQLVDDRPVPAGDVIKYNLYLANAITDPTKASPYGIATGVTGLTYTITLSTEGQYVVGLRSTRTRDGIVVSQSQIVWSDDPLVAASPFGLTYYALPQAVSGLRVSGQ